MGLDSRLVKKHYVKQWSDDKKLSITLNGEELKGINFSKVSYVLEEIGEWYNCFWVHNLFSDFCWDNGLLDSEKMTEIYNILNDIISCYENGTLDEVSIYFNDFSDCFINDKFRIDEFIHLRDILKQYLNEENYIAGEFAYYSF